MKNLFAGFLRGLILIISWISFRPKVYYRDPSVQKNKIDRPILLVSNHAHHLDGPVIGCVFWKDKIHYLAAADRFENPRLAWLMRQCRCIPIDRRNLDTAWLHGACDLICKTGEPLCIFPEGKHSMDGQILPFHSGVTTLAFIARVPVLLVYVHGNYNFWRRARIMIDVPREITLPATGLSANFVQEQTDSLREQMIQLQQAFLKETKLKIN